MRLTVVFLLLVALMPLRAAADDAFTMSEPRVVASADVDVVNEIGRTHVLADFLPVGEPGILHFWATWCGPCVQGMPHLQEVAAEFENVRIVGLSVDDEIEPVQKFFDLEFEPLYTVGWVGMSGYESMQIRGIPNLFVVDESGTIVDNIVGYVGEDDTRLEDALEALLSAAAQ